jgi:hypothetical protein
MGVPTTMAWHVLKVVDDSNSLQIWREAVDILNRHRHPTRGGLPA